MGEEFIQLYDISDEEIKYLLAGQDAFDVLFNLVKNNPGILSKYAKRLGTSLKKNSKLLKMNLPALAFELYKKKDPVFTEKIHSILDRNIRLLKSNIDDLYKGEMTEEDVKNFNCDEILDFLNRYVESVDANSLDLETFFIQCKLCDIIYSEETIKEVKEKWEDRLGIIKDVAEESEVQTEMQPEKKKITKSKKTVSPQEKAAKQKAAEKNKKKEVAIEEENVGELDNNIEEDTTRDTNVKEEIIEKEIKTVTVKEQKMDKHYVGSISIKGNFYNWNPIGQIIGNDFEFFRESDVEALLPKSVKLNINLSYNFWDEQSGKFVSQFHDGQLLIVDYEVDEMEENRDADMNLNPTGYKVPFQEGFKNGKIKLLSEIGFYSVKEKSILLEDIFSKNGVKIADDDLIEGEKILIRIDKDFLAGPYKVEYRPTLNSFVIKTDTVNNKYLLKGYNISDCKKVLFEKVFASNWNEQTEWYYFTIKDENKFVTKDVISNSALLESFGSVIEKQGDETLRANQLSTLADKYKDDLFTGEGISEEIKRNRLLRIREIISTEDERQTEYNGILEFVSNMLINNIDNDKFSSIIDTIVSKDDFIDKIQNVKIIREKIESYKQEILQLQAQKDQLLEDNKSKKTFTADDDSLDDRYKQKSVEYKELCEKLEVAEDLLALKTKCDSYKDEIKYYENHKERLTNANKTLEAEFVEMVNDHSKKIAEISFDGFMSSKMLQAASEWEETQKFDYQNEIVERMNAVESSDLTGEKLVDYLVSTIQIERPQYDHNFIVNLMTCMMQGFLTVFSGAPGCGKTSICNITGKVLGLKNQFDNDDMNRYIVVSVERGWTSKRDFIGYYNPLTKAFEESNREVFEGLRLLNIEYEKGLNTFPFVVLLDEANLSPMEYYWADFMNVCDDLKDNHSINLGNNNIFDIPETLHFVATINNDHTTEVLSPRLIDRAWIITLPENRMLEKSGVISDSEIKQISWESLKETFVFSEDGYVSFPVVIQKIIKELKDLLAKENMYISARVEKTIKRYWAIASSLMEEDDMGTSSSVVALDYAIAQKILPRISGNGDEYLEWLKSLKDFANSNNLSISEGIIDRIINQGNRQMKFYQFFN